MRGWRHSLCLVLICLPALMIIGLGGAAIAIKVPSAIRYEPRRIGIEYREIAESIAEEGGEKCARQVGWWQAGKIDGVPWGYVESGDDVIVWIGNKGECLTRRQKAIRPFPYALVYYGGGGIVALVLMALSCFAAVGFSRYVRVRDDFLTAAAHDLTTPLVAMRSLIGRNDGEVKMLCQRMLVIVDNIKEFLRGGSDKAPQLSETDLVAACREAYSLFRDDYRELFDGNDIEMTNEGECVVMANEMMLMRILWNLFGNDLKYAAPYGKVAVRIAARGDSAIVEFADEGLGMSTWQLRRAFNRYYRARTVMESGKGGFGIGLCVARDMARSMGGDLRVRANSPKGCVFTLILRKPTEGAA